MTLMEDLKANLEQITGYRRPKPRQVSRLRLPRKPRLFHFKDDGATPNNPNLPLLLYRGAVELPDAFDPAAILEQLFAVNGWRDSWRDGIYGFLHFHTRTHEVLGIACGSVRVKFGGAKGKEIGLKAGDVVVLPAGTGHKRLARSRDLLVVGAYPETGGKYDEPRPSQADYDKAVVSITAVRLPGKDPVYGKNGPLKRLWRPSGEVRTSA
jgi:uncharacterized protein YjlB